jgi:hypothetical protein
VKEVLPALQELLEGPLPAPELVGALTEFIYDHGPDAMVEALRELRARGVVLSSGAGWALREVQARGLLPGGRSHGPT